METSTYGVLLARVRVDLMALSTEHCQLPAIAFRVSAAMRKNKKMRYNRRALLRETTREP